MTQLSIVFERILDSIQKVFSNLFGWIIALFSAYLAWLGNDSGSFLLVLILIVATSCPVCRNCRNAAPNSTYQKDSVIIKESIIYRDTLIPVIVKDTTVQDRAVLTDTARAETDFAKAKAWLERDSLKLTISNKPSPIPPVKAKLPEKAKTELHTKTITEIKTVEVNRLTKWQKTMISLGYVFIGICGAGIIVFIIRIMRCR